MGRGTSDDELRNLGGSGEVTFIEHWDNTWCTYLLVGGRAPYQIAQWKHGYGQVLPDERDKQLTYKDYDETLAWDDRTQQWGSALMVKAYEFVSNVEYGTWGRVSVYTWGQVAAYTWSQVANL
jgi:hypothetical protein